MTWREEQERIGSKHLAGCVREAARHLAEWHYHSEGADSESFLAPDGFARPAVAALRHGGRFYDHHGGQGFDYEACDWSGLLDQLGKPDFADSDHWLLVCHWLRCADRIEGGWIPET